MGPGCRPHHRAGFLPRRSSPHLPAHRRTRSRTASRPTRSPWPRASSAAASSRKSAGQAYLGSLAANTPSAANIRRYAEIVRERAIMRSLAAIGTEIADTAFNPMGRDARRLMLDEAEGQGIPRSPRQGRRRGRGSSRSTRCSRRPSSASTAVQPREQERYHRARDRLSSIWTAMTSGLQAGRPDHRRRRGPAWARPRWR